ncbi:hypothetical protein H257_16062 [Aphanomyces astaci]|uniref:C2H2-type domain-containing protein n=1 Tax=Aphanomyces astaci TaxID=112090 RepID=W4FLP9_APHAT|nr:hypothetical protein H257_16062 [Aphanomyces astaci]ETV67826.1 hypothetical protein H257_16062 [Aphanomyces astaci]|eukprot:XP_009842684.1 hypothetical protein H257_16062 [Aphanomyces astaci]
MEFDNDNNSDADVAAAQASVEDETELSITGVESQTADQQEEESATVTWLEQRVTEWRCKCPRCIYARPRMTELPDTFECPMLNGSKRCRLQFPSNELLVVHQLDVHEGVYPICPKQRLTMQNHMEYSAPRPPPTVYMFQQRHNPLIKPDQHLDVSEEVDRVRVQHDVEVAASAKRSFSRKRNLDGFVKMPATHEEPETAMFDVFMEAAERWKRGDKYERLAQFQEAMLFYQTTKELPAPTAPSQYPLVGQGRNWFKLK